MAAMFRDAAVELERMRADGVELDPEGMQDDYAYLVTFDPEVARKYGMQPEDDFDDDEADDAPSA